MGSVRSQLFMAWEIIAQLDAAQEHRTLNELELSLCRQLKLATLGLASLARTIARQRSRIRHLEEGDANTKYFHMQACHTGRKNQIPTILHDDIWVSDNGEKSNIIYEYCNDILGKPFLRSHSIELSGLLPQLDLSGISILMSTASTRVIVNGRPGRRIAHARGLRQGDPISPMLFVIVMEVLNSLIREADRRSVLSPLPGTAIPYRASLYADDLIVLTAPKSEDLQCLHHILQLFAGASGLITNVDECVATPICCDDDIMKVLVWFWIIDETYVY